MGNWWGLTTISRVEFYQSKDMGGLQIRRQSTGDDLTLTHFLRDRNKELAATASWPCSNSDELLVRTWCRVMTSERYASDQWQHRCGFTGLISTKPPEEASKQAGSCRRWKRFLLVHVRYYWFKNFKRHKVSIRCLINDDFNSLFLLNWSDESRWFILGQLHNNTAPMICMT